MIRGVINPKKILGNTSITPEAFQKFMLGDTPGLTSIASKAAANNIVKFNSSSIKASSGVSSELLNDISTNIVTNVNNSLSSIVGGLQSNINQYISKVNSNVNNSITLVQKQFSNIQTQLQEGFSSTVKQFEDDYRNKITAIEDRTPSRILSSFLKIYENAIGFVNFFGDQKNISKITQKLKRLRGIFTESFEVAKIIRQVINKIVKQLTNLPTASSSGGGGLNVDIDVPGGALKRSGGSRLGNIMKTGGKVALGALGVVGAAAGVSAIASTLTPAKEYQQRKLEESKAMRAEPPSIFDEIASVFTKAVDKFTNIIQQLTDESNTPPKSSESSGQSSSSSLPASPGASAGLSPPGSEGTPGIQNTRLSGVFSNYPGISALLRTIQVAEGTARPGQDPYKTMFGGGQFEDLSKHPDEAIHSGGYTSAAAGAYQFLPNTWKGVASKKNLTDFSPASQDIGAVEKILERTGIKSYDELEARLREKGFSKEMSNMLAPEWASLPTLSGSSYYGQHVRPYGELSDFYNQAMQTSSTAATSSSATAQASSATPTTPPSTPTLSNLFPTNTQFKLTGDFTGQAESSTGNMNIENIVNLVRKEDAASYKQAISTAPAVISMPETNVVDATTASGQSSGQVPQTQSIDSSSPTVPFMSASNPDNFYVHLAALTFNLVNR